MRFPVYPEKLRKTALIKAKIRYPLLAMLVAGILIFSYGCSHEAEGLIVAGALIGAAGFCFFGTLDSGDALICADIGDNEIRIIDKKGNPIRSTEYRYVRKIEIRSLQVTNISSEHCDNFPGSGIDTKLIMVYFDGVKCFEDMKLQCLSRKYELYWCDKILWHYNCIAFLYNADAWNLLNARMENHRK